MSFDDNRKRTPEELKNSLLTCNYGECKECNFYESETPRGYSPCHQMLMFDQLIEYIEKKEQKGKWQRRKGEDCWECSQCHTVLEDYDIKSHNFYFCYHCGANMMTLDGLVNIEEVKNDK